MSLKDKWVNRRNDEDFVSAEDINSVARAVIEIEDNLQSKDEVPIELDTTLTQEGKAADAKAVGDAIANAPYVSSNLPIKSLPILREEAYPDYGWYDLYVDVTQCDKNSRYMLFTENRKPNDFYSIFFVLICDDGTEKVILQFGDNGGTYHVSVGSNSGQIYVGDGYNAFKYFDFKDKSTADKIVVETKLNVKYLPTYNPTNGDASNAYTPKNPYEPATKKYVDDAMKNAGGGADYNQNNPSANDYIKNRPFYSEKTTFTLCENLHHVPTEENNFGTVFQVSMIPSVGDIATIIFNGNTHTAAAENFDGSIYVVFYDNEPDFLVLHFETMLDGTMIGVVICNQEGVCSLSVEHEEVRMVADKFLPMVERIENMIVFDSWVDYENADRDDPEIKPFEGQHSIFIDGEFAEDVEFIYDPYEEYSWAVCHSLDFISRIETWNGGIWFELNSEEGHDVRIVAKNKSYIKPYWLPPSVPSSNAVNMMINEATNNLWDRVADVETKATDASSKSDTANQRIDSLNDRLNTVENGKASVKTASNEVRFNIDNGIPNIGETLTYVCSGKLISDYTWKGTIVDIPITFDGDASYFRNCMAIAESNNRLQGILVGTIDEADRIYVFAVHAKINLATGNDTVTLIRIA